MGWFSKDKAEEQANKANEKKAQSWDDKMAAALPAKAVYFDAMRTNAYENQNFIKNFAEFWAAFLVDKEQDLWRVMHYTVYDLDKEDGQFTAKVLGEKDVSFAEAVYQLSNQERVGEQLGTHKKIDFTQEAYPAAKYPELQVHFFNIEHYKTAANIEGIAFDNNGEPYRRIDGKIFTSATFQRSEVNQSILAAEQARENEKVKNRIEDGVLSDIFNSKAEPNASLDNIIKVGRALAAIDPFTAAMGAFYLGIQKVLGKNDGYNAIESLSPEDKKAVLAKAKEILPSDASSIQDLVSDVLPQAREYLDQADSIGVHTEPFRKHLAEVELYASLLNASQCFKKLKSSIVSAQGADAQALVGIQEWVSKAKNQYLDLGGPIETFDRLQAWVANDNKDTIPGWIPKWIDRYYDQRQKAMKKVQERQLNVREVNVIGAKVKPPIVE